MDVIAAVGHQIEPFVMRHGLEVSISDPIGSSINGQVGLLELHSVLPCDRLLLLGLYQVPAEQAMIAQIWSLDAGVAPLPASRADQIATRRRVWRYDADTDRERLAREIICVVTSWLEPNGSAREAGASSPRNGTSHA